MMIVKRILNFFSKENKTNSQKISNIVIPKEFDPALQSSLINPKFTKEEIIRYTAYLEAEKDNFKQHPDYYWLIAEKKINDSICILS